MRGKKVLMDFNLRTGILYIAGVQSGSVLVINYRERKVLKGIEFREREINIMKSHENMMAIGSIDKLHLFSLPFDGLSLDPVTTIQLQSPCTSLDWSKDRAFIRLSTADF